MNRPALQVAFFTAQADPRSCALSPAQRDFLRRLGARANLALVEQNFPYHKKTRPWRPRPLWRESVSVARQYWASRRPSFARRYRPAVLELITCAEETVFLAGSCGLELLQRLRLPPCVFQQVSFIAYGTVARARPSCPGLLVLGRRDWIARHRGPTPDRALDCGHLDYLANEEFAALSADFVRRRLAALHPHHAAAL